MIQALGVEPDAWIYGPRLLAWILPGWVLAREAPRRPD
jgi:hypothetical protein